MSNTTASRDSALTTESRASSTSKLLQAAALAAVLVPLGTVAVESAEITCGFGESFGDVGSGTGCFASSPNSSQFNFGAYVFELTFDLLGPDFEVTVTTTPNIEFDGENFPGYECILLSEADGCVDFQVNTHGATFGTHWDHYKVAIDWQNWDSPQVLEADLMRMLHDSSEFNGPQEPGTYDFDMCITPGYDACEAQTEPRIGSGDTFFDSYTAALAPAQVPEPSSLLLLATGLGGAFIRRRRRSKV